MVVSDHVDKFHKNGIAVIPDFLTDQEIADMRQSILRIMDQMDPAKHSSHVFRLGASACQSRDDYFLTSGDQIRFFFEPDAVDEEGTLLVDKHVSVNKIGHALGVLDDVFHKVTFSNKVKEVCRQMGLVDPRLAQSMYIFKNPGHGQHVSTHQDSTFLHVDPPSKLLGFWFALEDASVENGCLYYIPGSHHTLPTARFVRSRNKSGPTLTEMHGVEPNNPIGDFVAAPVKKGSLVLIHGNVIHRSERNTSPKSRHAYTFHVVDFHDAQYSPDNWLQPTSNLPFPQLYQTDA